MALAALILSLHIAYPHMGVQDANLHKGVSFTFRAYERQPHCNIPENNHFFINMVRTRTQ